MFACDGEKRRRRWIKVHEKTRESKRFFKVFVPGANSSFFYDRLGDLAISETPGYISC